MAPSQEGEAAIIRDGVVPVNVAGCRVNGPSPREAGSGVRTCRGVIPVRAESARRIPKPAPESVGNGRFQHRGDVSDVPESVAQVNPKLFEEILDAPGALLALPTERLDDLLGEFRRLALRGGHTIFHWNPDQGIASLGASEQRLPGTKRLVDALRYMSQSIHFAVYLVSGFEKELSPPVILLLRRISASRRGSGRRLVFVAPDFALPETLENLFMHLDPIHDRASERPRLRGGRWVV